MMTSVHEPSSAVSGGASHPGYDFIGSQDRQLCDPSSIDPWGKAIEDDTESFSCPAGLQSGKSNPTSPTQRRKAFPETDVVCPEDCTLFCNGGFDMGVEEVAMRLRHASVQVSEVGLEGTSVRCIIRAHKYNGASAIIRATTNGWGTHNDYTGASSAELSGHDDIAFEVFIPITGTVPEIHFEFAACVKANGQEFWDNNHSQNYKVTVVMRQAGRSRSNSLSRSRSNTTTAL